MFSVVSAGTVGAKGWQLQGCRQGSAGVGRWWVLVNLACSPLPPPAFSCYVVESLLPVFEQLWYKLSSACFCFPFSADMSKQAQLMEMLKKEVRSLLMAAKEGLTPVQLEQEYKAMIGKPLPVRDLGYRSTLELVADMPEVVRVCPYEKGTFVLKGEV